MPNYSIASSNENLTGDTAPGLDHPNHTTQSATALAGALSAKPTDNGKNGRKSPGAFRTISEVANMLGVQQHVLRFWESKFSQVKPLKRGGGRRYYRPEDIDIIRQIHHLLYIEGYTIKGVQKLLRGHGKSQIANGEFKGGEFEKEQTLQSDRSLEDHTPKPAKEPTGQNLVATNAIARDIPATKSGSEKRLSSRQRAIISSMLGELKELRDMINPGDNPAD